MSEDSPRRNYLLLLLLFGASLVLGGLLLWLLDTVSDYTTQVTRLQFRVSAVESTLARITPPPRYSPYSPPLVPSTTRTLVSPQPALTSTIAITGALSRTHTNTVPAASETTSHTPTSAESATATVGDGTVLLIPNGTLNVRTGPGTGYPILGQIPAQVPVQLIGSNEAQTWFVIQHQSRLGWIYGGSAKVEGDVTKLAVTGYAPLPATSQPRMTAVATSKPANSSSLPGSCPQNCTACVAAGWTASQCGQCPNLDRDKDGVACYGD